VLPGVDVQHKIDERTLQLSTSFLVKNKISTR
jgi:hypothetical protein